MSVQFTRLENDYSYERKNVKIAMNKSLLKEFKKDNERVVYLEDGNEFQIQIFNDQTTEIGAKIYVNGEMIGNSYLVIRPGERVWLDRYISKARKFKFSTYEVNGNNKQVKKAIQKNGLVKVELFRKKENNYYIEQPLLKTWEPDYAPQIYYCNQPYSNICCDTVLTSSTSEPASINTFCSTLGFADSASSTTAASQYTTATATANIGGKVRSLSKSVSNKTETGRIQEGSHSNQEFDYVNMSFEYWAFDTEEIHILPKSTKPVYADELQKTYCYNCGRKLKSKFNFCPFCGAKL